MSDRIVGINRTSLWKAWKTVRKNLRNASVRDVIDFLEYDVDPDIWINRLLRQIREGNYEPNSPSRFTLAKSKGFSRVMTFPVIPDLVLYRSIVDEIYKRAKHGEHKHVYFERGGLSKVLARPKQSATDRGPDADDVDVGYGASTPSRFRAWKYYDQYRRYLIFKKLYAFIVTTDITNFFDSVLYNRVAESLVGISTNRRLVGLLFYLLERFSVRDAYTESPRIGLPVDEFDCSRKLAHLILFPHDDRMVSEVGEEAYVRWMDDQNFGVSSRSLGLRVLAKVGNSLARLHLTPNAEKSRVLSLKDASLHFHLRINKLLDKADDLPIETRKQRKTLGIEVKRIWKIARKYEGIGEWSKVLKRLYRLAGIARVRALRSRAIRDVLKYPDLVRRITDYMRSTSTVPEYLNFVRSIWNHPEQLYPDVNMSLTESLLRLEGKAKEVSLIRSIGSDLLRGKILIPGNLELGAIAPLIILRFGNYRSLPLLRTCFENRFDRVSAATVRSAAIVYCSYGVDEFRVVRRMASRLLRNYLAEMVRFIERIMSYKEVPVRYKARINTRFDPVTGRDFLDMRSLLAARILNLNRKRKVQEWVRSRKEHLLESSIQPFEKRLLNRLL